MQLVPAGLVYYQTLFRVLAATLAMFSSRIKALALALALAQSLVSAAIFPKSSHVEMLDVKGFHKAMKTNVRLSLSEQR